MKKVLCSWESPLANCLAGAPGGDYLSRAIVDCSGAPDTDTAFMGLTSRRRVTVTGTIARRRRPGRARGELTNGFRKGDFVVELDELDHVAAHAAAESAPGRLPANVGEK